MIRIVYTPQAVCRFGLAHADITPPVGIYHRMWGAATHDRATGVHQPLRATAMALAPEASAGRPFVILALDHCLLWNQEITILRQAVMNATQLAATELVITFSHTHAAGLIDPSRASLPGGELIQPYFEQLVRTVTTLTQDAIQRLVPAHIVFGVGRCSLAAHRDRWDEDSRQWVCGYHPEVAADDTVLVGRVTDASQRTIATIVNYACHPTTLAWENTLISPDYPGAMRGVVERATHAPCLFLLGACGEVGPHEGYVGDVEVADRNGRQLGYAALEALESLPPPQTQFAYRGPVLSGATLGDWRHQPLDLAHQQQACRFTIRRVIVPLPCRADRPTSTELAAERMRWQQTEAAARAASDESAARDARAQVERATRAITRWAACPPGETFPFEVTLIQCGDAILVCAEGEPYQLLQTELRRRCPDVTIFVVVLADGWRSAYLPTSTTYGRGVYQEQVALLAPGCLERVIDAAAAAIAELTQ